MQGPDPSFEDQDRLPRFFIYKDTEQFAVLDYDPVAAAERAEEALVAKDAIIARLSDQISEKEAKLIESARREQDALELAGKAKDAVGVVETLNIELRVRLRALGRKILSYGK